MQRRQYVTSQFIVRSPYSHVHPAFNVPPLLSGQQYTGPLLGFANLCTCSTVTYSMVAACGFCQGGIWDTCVTSIFIQHSSALLRCRRWTAWKFNCSPANISISSCVALSRSRAVTLNLLHLRFPISIPPGTTVPSWAYLDVTVR
jgi:hypothetical protein